MYIDIVPNRNSPPAILIRESYRENGKVKKRTVANISKLPENKIEQIKNIFNRKHEQSLIDVGPPTSGPIYGVLFILKKIADQLKITGLLGSSRMATLALFLVLARIAHQGSRLSAVRWSQDHATSEIMGITQFDEDDLYAALDWIDEKHESIEKALYKNYVKDHGKAPALVLYDVTSSYLEGEQNELAAYGYNRDGKKGKKQIVIGLLTAPDGEPLSVEVFKGNTADPVTVANQIEKIVSRFQIKELVFVGDRGMVKSKGKKELGENHFKYITAITDAQIKKLIQKNIIQPGLFDDDVFEVTQQEKRYILRCDPITRRKEEYRRTDKLERLKQTVKERNEFVMGSKAAKPLSGKNKIEGWIKRHKLASFVTVDLNDKQLELTIDEAAKNADALLDGCYVIESNVDAHNLSKNEIHDRYRDLQKVELNFKRIKTGFLQVRPIFLRKEKRTRAHVFVSMLALKIERELEARLKKVFGTTDDNPHTETVQSALTAFSRLCLLTYNMQKQNIVTIPRPDSRQQKILEALGVRIAPPSVTASI